MTSTPPARFDLVAETEQMRAGAQAHGHATKTLLRSTDLRLVLMMLRRAAEVPAHHAEGALTIQALDGRARIATTESTYELVPGQVLALEPAVRHAITALEDCAILLTISWRGAAPSTR